MSVEGSLIGLKYNDTMYYYIKNMQEDIIGITDSNNNILCSYMYAYVSNNSIKNSDSNGKGKTWNWIAKKLMIYIKKAREAVSKVFGTKTYVSTSIEGFYCTMDNKILSGINIKSGMVEVCSIGDDNPITFYSEISGMPGVGVEFNVMNLNVDFNSAKYAKADYSYKIDNNSIHSYFRTDVNIFYLLPVPIKTIEFNPYPFVKYAF